MTEDQKIENIEDENTNDVEGHGRPLGPMGSKTALGRVVGAKGAEADDSDDDVEGHASLKSLKSLDSSKSLKSLKSL